MAGLVPAIHGIGFRRGAWVRECTRERAWVYIMTNRPNGALYTGVTSNLPRRVWEHRKALVDGFTKRYGLKRLVYTESHADISFAIQRERKMKHWPRA